MKKIRHITSLLLVIIPFWLIAQTAVTNKNYIQISTVKKDSIDNPGAVNIQNAHQNVQYFDGIGRPNQVVQIQTTPNQTDLVQVINYDNLGRETVSYLPYAVAVGMGDFDPDWQTAQPGYYANPVNGVELTNYPFAVKSWDNSPLNRVMAQGAAGAPWQLGQNPVGFSYQTNAGGIIPQLGWDKENHIYVDEGYYDAGKLYITQTTDENGSITKEYKNLSGQVILKTSYLGIKELSTYYIYDDFNNLVCVIPPEAYQKVVNNVEGFDGTPPPTPPVVPEPTPEPSTLINGLASYYTLDETTGNAIDTVGSNDGTITGLTQGASGHLGTSYSFDGVGDYISMGNVYDINPADSVSLSCWVNFSADESGTIISKSEYYSPYKGWKLRYNTGDGIQFTIYPDFLAGNKLNVKTAFTPTVGTWYHISLTYDGTGANGVKIYINNSLQALTISNNNASGSNVNTFPFNIGSVNNATLNNSFSGSIDEVGFWQRTLTAAEVAELYDSGQGNAYPFVVSEPEPTPVQSTLLNDLISCWEFDETTGTIANDTLGNNDGIINGATLNQPGIINNKAYGFDGNDFIEIDNSSTISPKDRDWSISSWFKLGTVSAINNIISQMNGANSDWFLLSITAEGTLRWVVDDGSNPNTEIISSNRYDDNNWHNTVLTRNAAENTWSLFVDGVLLGSSIDTDSSVDSDDEFLIGAVYGSGGADILPKRNFFNGLIDQVCIWGKQLTTAEIAELYNSGNGLAYPFDGLTPEPTASTLLNDIVSYYKLDDLAGNVIDETGFNHGINTVNVCEGKIGSSHCADSRTGSQIALAAPLDALSSTSTLSYWIKTTQSGINNVAVDPCIVGVNIGDVRAPKGIYWGTINQDGCAGFQKGSTKGAFLLDARTGIDNGIWHHITLTWNSTSGISKIYKNGVLDDTRVTGTGDFIINNFTNYIGRLVDTTGVTISRFAGFLDEIGIWSRELTDAEVTELYNNGDGLSYPFEAPSVPVLKNTYLPDSSNFLDHVYTYKYDDRQRMIEKDIPGQEEVYMVYDKLDRLVATQDANMRQENKWLFTKYDVFSRPVMTGIYQNRTQTSRDAVQTLVDNETNLFESYDAGTQLYSCIAFPDAADSIEYLTYNYYDNYDFIDNQDYVRVVDAQTDPNFKEAHQETPKGLLTGSKVKILNTSDEYLYTINYYNAKDRLIQTITEHNMDGYDINNFSYDFIGNPDTTNLVHFAGLESDTMKWWYTYDHAGRLETVKHKINSQAEQYIIKNQYNDLGQLIEKNLHASTSDPNGAYKQSIDYAYNIRGWLKSINNAGLTEPDNDMFGMELLYNEGFADLNGTAMFNGNISGMQWKVQSDTAIRGYGFTYDSINRIKAANYAELGTIFDQNADHYTLNNISYDLNGNIQQLWRQGENTGSNTYAFGYIDKLEYAYTGNTLIAVEDEIPDIVNTETIHSDDFKDGNSDGSNEYTYDANGNMTSDANKGIAYISYNYLNLPDTIYFAADKKIIYLYNANGTKLKKKVITPEKTDSTTYAGSFVYDNETLSYVLFEEGRLEAFTDAPFAYQYFLKDHLGNTRVTFDANTESIKQQDHYYPFGMNFAGIDNVAGLANQYKYNGKELQADLDLNWYDYGARMYDAQIGRFHIIDPLSSLYPYQGGYVYAANDPIANIDLMGLQKVNFRALWWHAFSTTAKEETGYDLRFRNSKKYNKTFFTQTIPKSIVKEASNTINSVSESPMLSVLTAMTIAPFALEAAPVIASYATKATMNSVPYLARGVIGISKQTGAAIDYLGGFVATYPKIASAFLEGIITALSGPAETGINNPIPGDFTINSIVKLMMNLYFYKNEITESQQDELRSFSEFLGKNNFTINIPNYETVQDNTRMSNSERDYEMLVERLKEK